MQHPDDSAGFAEVLSAWSWWDAPRDGVVRIDGQPYRFRCDFDEALDDYPEDYRVWPITEAELRADLARWAMWVDWRRRFDRGEDPEPLEVSDLGRRSAPSAAAMRVAIPAWRLDADRSFAVRAPRHMVRFMFDDGGSDGPITRRRVRKRGTAAAGTVPAEVSEADGSPAPVIARRTFGRGTSARPA